MNESKKKALNTWLMILILCCSTKLIAGADLSVKPYTPAASSLLNTEPSTTEIQKRYYPWTKGNGWHLHNTYREALINLRLHECKELEQRVIPACEDGGVATPKKIWESPYFYIPAALVSGYFGYRIGKLTD